MPADVTSLDVEYLFTLTAEVGIEPYAVLRGSPSGTRVVADVTGGSVEGPRVRGRIVTPGGDWLVRRANGVARLDVRLLIVTEDDASIYVTYEGINDNGRIRVAPLFETGDERYAWLNDIQAVGIGARTETGVAYEVYALR